MKAFLTLYWKELKSSKIMIFFIIIGAYGINSFLKPGILRTSEPSWILDDLNVYLFSTAVLFVLPLIFFYMIISERRENSKHLLFSLPIKRYWIILSNFFVVMSYVVFIPIGFIIGYVCIRLPQIVGLCKKDGFKVALFFLYQYVLYLIVSFLFYGVGLVVRSIL